VAYFGEAGPASYSTQIFAGTYDVYLTSGSEAEQSVLPPSAQTLLAKDLKITADLTRNFDVKVVTVKGEVTLNSAVMPDNSYYPGSSRGLVRFVDTQTPTQTVDSDIGSAGKASFSAMLFGGTYNIMLVPSSYQDSMPTATARLAANASITGDQTKNYNVKTISVSGEVTMNGATMPDDSYYARGSIRFQDSVLGTYVDATLGVTGPAAYTAELFSGTYDVLIVGSYYATVLPDASTRVSKDVSLSATTTKNFDVGVATLSGEVTLNGGTMPDNGVSTYYYRGYLEFVDPATLSVIGDQYYVATIGATGAASYTALVFKTTYDVFLQSNAKIVQDVLPPNTKTQVQKGLKVTADSTNNFNVKVFNVTGNVTISGKAMKDDTILDGADRGWVSFVNPDTLDEVLMPVGETGTATYDAKVFGGTYNVFLVTNTSALQDALPGGVTTRLQDGFAISKDTTRSFNKDMALVSGVVTLNQGVMPNDTIADDNDRAWLSFVEKTGGTTPGAAFQAFLGETGAANYAASIFTGSYDVFFTTNDGTYQNALPENASTRVRTGCTK